jgi:hypothetical protein
MSTKFGETPTMVEIVHADPVAARALVTKHDCGWGCPGGRHLHHHEEGCSGILVQRGRSYGALTHLVEHWIGMPVPPGTRYAAECLGCHAQGEVTGHGRFERRLRPGRTDSE